MTDERKDIDIPHLTRGEAGQYCKAKGWNDGTTRLEGLSAWCAVERAYEDGYALARQRIRSVVTAAREGVGHG